MNRYSNLDQDCFQKKLRLFALACYFTVAMTSVQATVILTSTTTSGSLTVASGINNGANSFVADGGPDAAPYVIVINSRVYLTGDASGADLISITGNNYTTITNLGNLVTYGSGNGISSTSGSNLTVSNLIYISASIRSLNGTGITLGSGDDIVNNTSEIYGVIGVNTGAGNDVMTSSYFISGSGGTAIDLGTGNDQITLNDPSLVGGDIVGGDGTDTITFHSTSGDLNALVRLANFQSVSVTGGVLGFESGVKTGRGTASIDGSTQITSLDIQEGGLYLSGGYAGSPSTVTVGGSGTVAELGGIGNFDNVSIVVNDLGTISSSRSLSVGDIDLSNGSSLTFNSGSVYRADIEVTTNTIDTITGGTVTINSGSQLQLSPTWFSGGVDAPVQDGAYSVLTGTTSGNFDSAVFNLNGWVIGFQDNPAGLAVESTGIFTSSTVTLTPVADADGNFTNLTVTHNYQSVPGLTNGGVAVGNYLNTLVDDSLGNAVLADYLGYLDYSSNDDGLVTNAINALDPSERFIGSNMILHHGHVLNRTIGNHNALIRSHRRSDSISHNDVSLSLGISEKDSSAKICIFDDPSVETLTEDQRSDRVNLWASGSLESLDNDGGLSGLTGDGDSNQIALGADYRIGRQLYLGVFGQLAKTDFDLNSGESVDVDSTYYGLYANYGKDLGIFVDALVAYGEHDVEPANLSSYETEGINASLGGGYMFGNEKFSYGPTLGVDYQEVDVDGFTIQNPLTANDVLPLVLSDSSAESFRALLGVKANMKTQAGSIPLDLYGAARWAHDFSADDDEINGGFSGLPSGLVVKNASRAEDALLLDAGVKLWLTESLGLSLGYFGQLSLDDQGLDSHGGMLGVNYSF